MKKKDITNELRAELLQKSEAFQRLTLEDITLIVELSGAKDGFYRKGDYIFREGDRIFGFGIILSGMVQSSKHERNGRVIFKSHHPYELLADDLVFSGTALSPCEFTAMEDTWIVWIEIPHSMEVLARRCANHTKLLHNLIRIMANRNIALMQRVQILTQKTMREKLLCYLEQEATKCGEKTFDIPFTRDELADYLGVDRSALSRTISAMKKENIIDSNGKRFTINF